MLSLAQFQQPLREAQTVLRASGDRAVISLFEEDIHRLLTCFQTFREQGAALAGTAEMKRLDSRMRLLEKAWKSTLDPSGRMVCSLDTIADSEDIQHAYDEVGAMIEDCDQMTPYLDAQWRQATALLPHARPKADRRTRRRS